MEKRLTTRKDHKCAFCGGGIPKGSIAFYSERIYPVFDMSSGLPVRKSIHYEKGHFHVHTCDSKEQVNVAFERWMKKPAPKPIEEKPKKKSFFRKLFRG